MPKTPVNSIQIPADYVAVCEGWYSGIHDLLYAVCSTGNLTTGTTCPIHDYTDSRDRERKWYYLLWCDLSVDVGVAARAARKMAESVCAENYDGIDYVGDANLLEKFENWVDEVCARLSEEYGLEDWEY